MEEASGEIRWPAVYTAIISAHLIADRLRPEQPLLLRRLRGVQQAIGHQPGVGLPRETIIRSAIIHQRYIADLRLTVR